MPNQRIVDTKMPLAIFLMVLLGSDDLVGNGKNGESVKELVTPFYGKTISNNMSEELYNKNGSIFYREDEALYTPIVEHLDRYNFSALLKLFSHFWGINELQTVTTLKDVQRCYKIMLAHRTETPATKFGSEYCWKIAQLFLQKYNNVESLDSLAESYIIRRDMIRKAKGVLYLAGTTLKDALSISRDHEEASIIGDILSNKDITVVNIYLLNYLYLGVNREDASKEIETSIVNILDKAKAALSHKRRCPKFHIILLSDFDIPFSLLTDQSLLTRSTHLFTQSRNYRGQYLMFGNCTEEYRSLKRYLDFVDEKSYNVDLNSHKDSPYRIKATLKKSQVLSKQVSYKKLHPEQLKNLVRSSFIDHTEKDPTPMESYITPDRTQALLLPYLKETERLMERLVQEHDKAGWAKIVPSADLGFPNNVVRIAGGFLTGALYDWSCSVPIVPIDTTVNTCTSSVFYLSKLSVVPTAEEFQNIVDTIRQRAMDVGYSFDFKSGNHFITLAVDDSHRYYLVLHSSTKQAKGVCFGLYPNDHVWYQDNIKTIYNPEQTRFLRYIRGDAAVRFYDYAENFREFNKEIHHYIASEFAALLNVSIHGTPYTVDHYGMPTASSVAIGTFVVNVDDEDIHSRVVPIFSDYGKDLCLYQVSTQQEQAYSLAGTDSQVVLIPHGWGQVIDSFTGLRLERIQDEAKRRLVLQLENGVEHKHTVSPTERLTLSQKHVRSFADMPEFLEKHCKHINGSVKKVLHPVHCYCAKSTAL